ncbi:MAG: type II toxin-antitoxin system HipA family toxin [Pseudomonadota bacterium]
MNHVLRLEVMLGGQRVGQLAQGQGPGIFFQYDEHWLKTGFDIAPGDIRFTTEAQVCRDTRLFGGLHGVFADSLPDGWGLILMNRALRQQAGWLPQEIGPLDRLAYIGNRGMGALEYRPAADVPAAPLDWAELERMGAEAQRVLAGAADDVLAALRVHGGSPGGARPKVVVALHPGLRHCHSSLEPLRPGFRHWLVKFRGPADPLDMGATEYAYNRMAEVAGLRVPHAELLDVRLGHTPERLFAVERFDRDGDHRLHVLSLAGYAYADFRQPSLDYDQVLGATMAISRDHQEVVQAFRLMVFNVLTHNQDDHAKNFSFLRRDGRWALAPAYDLTFSRTGLQAQHSTAVNGSGTPGRRDVLALARFHRIAQADALIDEIRGAVARWPEFARAAGVERATVEQFGREFAEIDRQF